MCFGGGGDSTSNVQTPSYTPDQAYTAVDKGVEPTAKVAPNAGIAEKTTGYTGVTSGLTL